MRQWSRTQQVRRALGVALAIAAVAAPSAQAGHEDLGPKLAGAMINHRTDGGPLDPWAVRVIEYGVPAGASQVSPDSRAVDFRTATAAAAPASAPGGDGFQWGDAGLGAGAMFGLVALLAGAAVLLARRNQGPLPSR